MSKLECHSGASKEELIAFVEEHKGKKIWCNYEENLYPFPDDGVFYLRYLQGKAL